MSIATRIPSLFTIILLFAFSVQSSNAQFGADTSGHRLHLATGWYCGATDSFFDNDGDRRDWDGFKESMGMFFAQGRYQFATLNVGDREVRLNGLARVSVDHIKQTVDFDKGSDERSNFGLGVITFGLSGMTDINENLAVGVGLDAFLDVAADPDFQDDEIALTDGSDAGAISGKLKYRTPSFKGGLRIGHVNRTEEDFRSTNYAALSGAYQVWSNEKISISAGLNFSYQKETDDGGFLFGVAPIIKTQFNNGLALKIGNGCTEDYVNLGMYQVAGESVRATNALGLTVSKPL